MKNFLSLFPRWITIFATSAVVLGLYLITNNFQIFECQRIPLILGEGNIPCMEFTFWIYLSLFIYTPLILFALPKKYFIAFSEVLLWITLGYFVFFIIYPTTYPREEKLWSEISMWILNIDKPNNAFPSLHVFWVTFAGLFYIYVQPNWKGMLILLWGVLICLSTLTTKQHYLMDILVSIVIAILAYIYTRYKKLPRVGILGVFLKEFFS